MYHLETLVVYLFLQPFWLEIMWIKTATLAGRSEIPNHRICNPVYNCRYGGD
jgi:hypothetical protein